MYGNLQTTWGSRLVSLVGLALLFAITRERPHLSGRYAPLLVVQGTLDTGGYVALLTASYAEGAELAVAASPFGAVTTILARVFLHERISGLQLAGIVLVFVGVAALSR